MPAILFGSISTIADTSELQRHAFNDAFAAHALGWHWDREDYVAMLGESGGQNRVAAYAASLGQEVDASAIHETSPRCSRGCSAPGRSQPGRVWSTHSGARRAMGSRSPS